MNFSAPRYYTDRASLIPYRAYDRSIDLFQCEFFSQCDLVRLLSFSSILSFRYRHPVAAYFLFLVFPSRLIFPYVSINNVRPVK